MSRPRPHWRAARVLRVVFLPAVMTFALSSCGGDDTNGPPDDTTAFLGVMAGEDGSSGQLSVEADGVPAALASRDAAVHLSVAGVAVVINLTGTAALSDGSTVNLTGTWDTEAGAVSMTGGGYTFSGTVQSDGSVRGWWSHAGVEGVFSMRVATVAAEVHAYCGTFTGRELETDAYPDLTGDGLIPVNGTWNMVVDDANADVIVVTGDGDVAGLSGSRNGNSVTITVTGAQATGTITGTGDAFINGTYDITGSSEGTFQGSEAACASATESAAIASIVINPPGITRTNGTAPARLAYDSVLVFATARDAQGNLVAAPDLEWTFSGDVRTNDEVLPPGQKWLVPLDWTPVGSTPPETRNATVTVTSKNNTNASATSTVTIYNYF